MDTRENILSAGKGLFTTKMRLAGAWMTEKYFVPTDIAIEIRRL
jgi:hypothetical protein